MDDKMKKRLEDKGWTVGDTQLFLGLSDDEMEEVERSIKEMQEFSDMFYKAREIDEDALNIHMTI